MEIENIKFKAKQLNSGKWFEGDLVRLGNRVCIGGDHIKDGITDVDPSTVCMFTGLKDKNGVEVWEHDLLTKDGSVIYEVGYEGCGFKASIKGEDGVVISYEVTYKGEDEFDLNLVAVCKYDCICGNKFDRKEGEKNDEEKNI